MRESPSSERELRTGGFGRFNRRSSKMVNIVRTLFNLNKPQGDVDEDIIQRLDKLEKRLESSEEE